MAAFKKDQFSTRRLARNTLNILYVADYFYSFNPFISYTLFLLLCLINSFFGTFEKTQLQIEHFLEHLAKWHCVTPCLEGRALKGVRLLDLFYPLYNLGKQKNTIAAK